MLATHLGFTSVPQQGVQNGARKEEQHEEQHKEAQNPAQNAVQNGVAIEPLIQQRPDQQGGKEIERLHRSLRGERVCSAGSGAAGLGGRPRSPGGLLKPQAVPWAGGRLSAGMATGLGALLAATLSAGWGTPMRAEPAPRPPGLKILVEKTNMREGTHWLGVYGRVADRDQPGLWRVKIWQEWSDRVAITTDSIDCRPGRATRAGVTASKVVVQTLNPGGPINPANRLDHLIWWATCFPEQAGRDPAGLGPLARSLGFDGRQPEQFEVLSVPPLPHP